MEILAFLSGYEDTIFCVLVILSTLISNVIIFIIRKFSSKKKNKGAINMDEKKTKLMLEITYPTILGTLVDDGKITFTDLVCLLAAADKTKLEASIIQEPSDANITEIQESAVTFRSE